MTFFVLFHGKNQHARRNEQEAQATQHKKALPQPVDKKSYRMIRNLL